MIKVEYGTLHQVTIFDDVDSELTAIDKLQYSSYLTIREVLIDLAYRLDATIKLQKSTIYDDNIDIKLSDMKYQYDCIAYCTDNNNKNIFISEDLYY